MKKGRAGTMTHDYKRNGTTTLSATALATGTAEHAVLELGVTMAGKALTDH
jgi:hypothetical protein